MRPLIAIYFCTVGLFKHSNIQTFNHSIIQSFNHSIPFPSNSYYSSTLSRSLVPYIDNSNLTINYERLTTRLLRRPRYQTPQPNRHHGFRAQRMSHLLPYICYHQMLIMYRSLSCCMRSTALKPIISKMAKRTPSPPRDPKPFLS